MRELSEEELFGILAALDRQVIQLPTTATFDYNGFYRRVHTLATSCFQGIRATTYDDVATLLATYNAQLLRYPRKPFIPQRARRGQLSAAIALGMGLLGAGAAIGGGARGWVDQRPIEQIVSLREPLPVASPTPFFAPAVPRQEVPVREPGAVPEGYLPAQLRITVGNTELSVPIEEGFGWMYEEIPPEGSIFRFGSLMPERNRKEDYGYRQSLLIAMHTSKYTDFEEKQVERNGRLVTIYPPNTSSPIVFTRAAEVLLETDSRRWKRGELIPLKDGLWHQPFILVDRAGREHVFRFERHKTRVADVTEIVSLVKHTQSDVQFLLCAPRANPVRPGWFLHDQRTYWVLEGNRA